MPLAATLFASVVVAVASPSRCPGPAPVTGVTAPAPCPSASPAESSGLAEIGRVSSRGRAANLVGKADAASQGVVGPAQILSRPILRPGDVLETVPGVVVSQHSGEGKANQYYLRGFNLDHGTDLAGTISGVPINLPTHAHGQGYSDTNWLMPELVSFVEFKKGPYYADEGDFSTAGSYDAYYRNTIPSTFLVEGGNFGQGRVLIANSPAVGAGHLLYALEYFHDNGSFEHPDNYRRYNGVLRYSTASANRDLNVTFSAYGGRWNSSDQIPLRAVQDGQLGRFGLIDSSDGGVTHRIALSTQLQLTRANVKDRFEAYLVDYGLNLFSNFTYNVDALASAPTFDCDPATPSCSVPTGALDFVTGDQREQTDHRVVSGFKASRTWEGPIASSTLGFAVRNDNINQVGLFLTTRRARFRALSNDKVVESAYTAYAKSVVRPTPKLRLEGGLRADLYKFDVRDTLVPENSSKVTAGIVSPKATLAYEIDPRNEIYLNVGESFHSNDGRGVTIVKDTTGTLNQRVPPLVRAYGSELGYRFSNGRLRSTFAAWQLGLASELTFSGDAGTTSPARPTYRSGIEVTNFWTPTKWLTLDGDFAYSSAKYAGDDPRNPIGTHVPGSLAGAASAGVAVDNGHVFGALRMRYFGPRTLVEDDRVRSKPSTLYNLQLGARFPGRTRLTLDVINLFNAQVSDIDYFYASVLRTDPYYTYPNYTGPCPAGRTCGAGVNDIHFHPAVRQTIRIALSKGI